jgi:hypothetical protein
MQLSVLFQAVSTEILRAKATPTRCVHIASHWNNVARKAALLARGPLPL